MTEKNGHIVKALPSICQHNFQPMQWYSSYWVVQWNKKHCSIFCDLNSCKSYTVMLDMLAYNEDMKNCLRIKQWVPCKVHVSHARIIFEFANYTLQRLLTDTFDHKVSSRRHGVTSTESFDHQWGVCLPVTSLTATTHDQLTSISVWIGWSKESLWQCRYYHIGLFHFILPSLTKWYKAIYNRPK